MIWNFVQFLTSVAHSLCKFSCFDVLSKGKYLQVVAYVDGNVKVKLEYGANQLSSSFAVHIEKQIICYYLREGASVINYHGISETVDQVVSM